MVFGAPQSSPYHSPLAPAADHWLASSSAQPRMALAASPDEAVAVDPPMLTPSSRSARADGQVVDHQAGGGIALVPADLEGVGAVVQEIDVAAVGPVEPGRAVAAVLGELHPLRLPAVDVDAHHVAVDLRRRVPDPHDVPAGAVDVVEIEDGPVAGPGEVLDVTAPRAARIARRGPCAVSVAASAS